MLTFNGLYQKYWFWGIFFQKRKRKKKCDFNLKFGTYTNLNMDNLLVMLCFSSEIPLESKFYWKSQNCHFKLKFGIQINLNMKTLMLMLFLCCRQEKTGFGQIRSKHPISDFRLETVTQTNLYRLNSLVVLTLLVLDQKYRF